MTSPAYLRDLARTYESANPPTPARLEVARRLHAIAAELAELQADMTRNNERAPTTPRDLTAGTTATMARLRAAAARAPTPDEQAAIRDLVSEHRRAR